MSRYLCLHLTLHLQFENLKNNLLHILRLATEGERPKTLIKQMISLLWQNIVHSYIFIGTETHLKESMKP